MNAKLLINTLNMQKYLYRDLYDLEEVHWWHKAKRNLVNYFLDKYIRDKRNRILDVGCGTGKNIETFSKFGKTWGIDSSSEAILFCKKRGIKNIKLGDIKKIPFTSNSFDFVTALDVLEHVDDSEALKEIHRVLAKGGYVIATVPAYSILWSRWDEILHHKRRYTKSTLEKIFKKNEYKIIKTSYLYSFLFLPTLIVRSIKEIFYKTYYPSDFNLSNSIINTLFGLISAFEKIFVTSVTIPFGTSLITIAQKKD